MGTEYAWFNESPSILTDHPDRVVIADDDEAARAAVADFGAGVLYGPNGIVVERYTKA